MVVYRLHYFNAKARAEGIRWLFALAGVQFEDIRFEFKEWNQIKPKMPLGYVPVLEVDGQYLSESQAIGRYLANKFGYAGKSDWEKALADQFVDALYDILAAVRAVGQASDEQSKVERLKDLIENVGRRVLRYFENQLTANSSGYLVGDGLTWVDVFVVAYLDSFIGRISPEFGKMLESFPKVSALLDKVREIPSIAAFIAKRPNTKF